MSKKRIDKKQELIILMVLKNIHKMGYLKAKKFGEKLMGKSLSELIKIERKMQI